MCIKIIISHIKKMNKYSNKQKLLCSSKGMMTVESAVIVPFLVLMIMGVCYMHFIFLDMAAAKGQAMIIANETAASWKTGGELEDGSYAVANLLNRDIGFLVKKQKSDYQKQAQSSLCEGLKKRLIMMRISDSSVNIAGDCVTVQVVLTFRVPLKGISVLLNRSSIRFTCTEKADLGDREEWLRIVSCIM